MSHPRQAALPPHDLDAERQLLGALLVTAHEHFDLIHVEIDEIKSIITELAFYLDQHRKVFSAIVRAHDRGEPTDLRAIAAVLHNLHPSIDWDTTLSDLSYGGDAANTNYYARIVRETARKRDLMRVGAELRERASRPLETDAVEEILTWLASTIDEIDQSGVGDRDPLEERDLLGAFKNPRNLRDVRIPVTLGHLGRILDGGFERGTLTTIGARPSCGKTSMGLGLCVHASRATGGCAAFFVSAEMTAQQIALRLLSMRSTLMVRNIRAGDVSDREFNEAVEQAVSLAATGKTVYVLDRIRNVPAIGAQIRRQVRRHDIGLAVIDYLGLLEFPGKFDRHDLKIGAMTSFFKSLAVDTNTAVVLLVQLSRGSDARKQGPVLADLKDSSCIEADADNVLLIHRSKDLDTPVCDTEIIVAKQRQGETGKVTVEYHKGRMMYQAKISSGLAAMAPA
ncbi:MAG: AAA family ATPase [Planctomycetes bacterium]|nr:AAA family ATPase [Planctomycetota bacterium]